MRISFRKLTRMLSQLGGSQLEQATSHPNRRRQQKNLCTLLGGRVI